MIARDRPEPAVRGACRRYPFVPLRAGILCPRNSALLRLALRPNRDPRILAIDSGRLLGRHRIMPDYMVLLSQ